jgi:tRNA A-37 threonylcarbamoyl transferase component Bud32
MNPPDSEGRAVAHAPGRACPECGRRFGEAARFCPFDGTPLHAASPPSHGAQDPLLGRIVGERYEVEKLLGEGGMGRVYRVRHVAIERRFALKVLRRELIRDPALGERFVREARAVALVRHSGIVAITDFGTLDDGLPYFVMELLEGETLAQAIRGRGPLPVAEVVRIALAIASAVDAAHRAGIIHRDLKPENVFLARPQGKGAEREVKVVDFGAAKVAGASSLTKEGIVFGTPHYMSPEYARGEEVDATTDVYALGCILFEMLTGRVPFDGDQFMLIMSQHMYKAAPRPSSLPAAAKNLGELDAIVLKALEKKRADRFASMGDLARALEAAVRIDGNGRVLVAPRTGATPSLEPIETAAAVVGSLRPSRAPRRASVWLWSAAAAVGVVVLGFVAFRVLVRGAAAEAREDEGASPAASGSADLVSAPALTRPAGNGSVVGPRSAAAGFGAPATGNGNGGSGQGPAARPARPAKGVSTARPNPGAGQPDLGDPWAKH